MPRERQEDDTRDDVTVDTTPEERNLQEARENLADTIANAADERDESEMMNQREAFDEMLKSAQIDPGTLRAQQRARVAETAARSKLDTTIPGGVMLNAAGKYVDFEGKEVKESDVKKLHELRGTKPE